MITKSEKDLWVEMSIREISTQAHFAGIAYKNLDPKAKAGTDAVFSSIHSFLSHCAMVSKMLKANDRGNPPRTIGFVLGVSGQSIIHKRKFRNNLEHYDRELQRWIAKFGSDVMIGTYNIGSKAAIQTPNMVFVSHYDPSTRAFTFVNRDFDLAALHSEAKRIQSSADAWVREMENGQIAPPYI